MIRSYCRHHREALAGWSCSTCRAKLCAQCVAEKPIETVRVAVCTKCVEQVTPLVEHRADTISYPERLRAIWRYPFSLGGIVGMCAMGFLFGLGSAGLLYLALAFAVFWSFMFVLIQSSARGEDDIAPPDFSSLWESIAAVLFRAFVATSASWVPLILYLWSAKPAFYDALVDPVIWLLAVFGLIYAPMAIMGAAVRTPMLRLLNPLWMVRCVALLGRDYWLAIGVLGLLFVLQCVVFSLATYILSIPIPFVPVAVAVTFLTYLPFLMARVVGLLLYVRGDKLGYGDPDDYYERIVTERPRGQLPVVEKVGLLQEASPVEAPKKISAIEVDF